MKTRIALSIFKVLLISTFVAPAHLPNGYSPLVAQVAADGGRLFSSLKALIAEHCTQRMHEVKESTLQAWSGHN